MYKVVASYLTASPVPSSVLRRQGKARSRSARSASGQLEVNSRPAPGSSLTCSWRLAFGITIIPSWRSSQASATCAGSCAVRARRDLGQRLVPQHAALLDRRIGHDRDVALAAPRDQVEFRAAPRQIVEDLVRGHRRAAAQPCPFFHVGTVEIADPVVADLAVALQLVERGERFGERVRAAPVQEVKIDAVGLEAFEAALASLDRAALRGVVGQYLADDEAAGRAGRLQRRRRSFRRRRCRTSRRCR